MDKYYIARVTMVMDNPNGKGVKKVTEEYLVRGVSVSDVEKKVYEDFGNNSGIEFKVSEVRGTKVCKVIDENLKAV